MKKRALGLTLGLSVFAMAAWATIEAPSQELMDYGFKSFGNGDYVSAVKYFEQVLEREPGNVEARLALKKAQDELAHQQKDAQKKGVKTAEAGWSQSEKLLKSGDVTASIDSLWNVLESDPKNKKAEKTLENLRAENEASLSAEPRNTARSNFCRGVLAYLDKDWSRAFDFFQEAKRLEPGDEEIARACDQTQAKLLAMIRDEQVGFYRESAKAFYDQGLYKESLSSWQKVMEIKPEDTEARGGITQSEEALARLENKVRSDEIIQMIERALSLYASRKWEASLQEWRKIAEKDPSVESAKEYISKIGRQLASIAKERSQENASSGDSWRAPRKPVASPLVAASLTSTEENFPEAIRNMEAILRRDPSNIKVAQSLEKAKFRQKELADKYYKDGLIAYSQGKLPEAIRQWQIVLRIDPEHAKARQAILKAQAESGT